MKPQPRLRKTIKWSAAAATTLLLVAWIASAWAMPRYLAPDWYGRLAPGQVAITYGTEETRNYPTNPWQVIWHPWSPWRWQGEWAGDRTQWEVAIPLWIPILATTLIAAFTWRLDTIARRRARFNLCPKCYYDRAGIAANAKCSECGAAPADG